MSLPGGGAIALSRGAQPKPYAHVDPNEDAGMLATTPAGILLALADGHNGARGSELALELALASTEKLLVLEPAEFERAVRDLVRTLGAALRPVAPSGTCLILLALVGGRGHVASFGDSALFRSSAREVVTPPNDLALRPRFAQVELPHPGNWCATLALVAGERLALVSDGVTAYVAEAERIPQWLAEAADDAAAAERIARAAMAGGAGDNVCVVTAQAG